MGLQGPRKKLQKGTNMHGILSCAGLLFNFLQPHTARWCRSLAKKLEGNILPWMTLNVAFSWETHEVGEMSNGTVCNGSMWHSPARSVVGKLDPTQGAASKYLLSALWLHSWGNPFTECHIKSTVGKRRYWVNCEVEKLGFSSFVLSSLGVSCSLLPHQHSIALFFKTLGY